MKKPHDLTIKIVIDALLSLTHNRISRLREFYDEGEMHFNIETGTEVGGGGSGSGRGDPDQHRGLRQDIRQGMARLRHWAGPGRLNR